ncbi:alpha/beta hydrolase [Rothia sp. AR01]|uniref:Alpha/beta hydrolase n=1 Tax=Rothia santali TaxID=2949643 RepID=A0A9X2KJK9_9MICC|nr:alpha/beta hydrolase [Rothia santali]
MAERVGEEAHDAAGPGAAAPGPRSGGHRDAGATAGSGPAPVVLLHGVGLDRTVWADVEERLTGREVLALDLPGHGAQPPLTSPVTLQDLADDVVGRLPEGPVHLVGFSLGALIAQRIAAAAPERVLSLTCVSAVCSRTPEEAEAVRGRLETARSDFRASMERAVDRWFPGDVAGNRERRDRTREVLLANDVESYLHAYAVFAVGDREVAPELPRITAPTLAITGELDPGSTPEMTDRLADSIGGARRRVVPGVRHMLPVEAPDALVGELTELITEAEGARHD